MAISARIETNTGETKELYLRVITVDANNHGALSSALVRGFISQEAFDDGKHFAHEESFEFNVDVSTSLWEQVYSHLKSKYPDSVDC